MQTGTDEFSNTLLEIYTNNPSAGEDWISSVAVDADGAYVVAGGDFERGTARWRVEKLVSLAPWMITNISVTPLTCVVITLQRQQFHATGTFLDSRNVDLSSVCTWASSDPSVATIDASGLATPTGQGFTLISARKGGLSGTAWLFVTNQPPTVVKPPLSQSVRSGTTATWNVAVNGSQPMSLQWHFNGVDIPGANNESLTVPLASSETAGLYSLVISNPFGTNTVQAALSLVDLKMFAGLIITGPPGHYRIEALENVGGTNIWTIFTTNQVDHSPFIWFDHDSPNHSKRFYRAIWQP